MVAYDKVFALAMTHPLVWEQDLKEWIREWQSQASIELGGLKPRERAPKLKRGHTLKALKDLT
jgi:hypothetical protein